MPQGLVIVITASSVKAMMQSAGQGDPTGLKPKERVSGSGGAAIPEGVQTCEIPRRQRNMKKENPNPRSSNLQFARNYFTEQGTRVA